MKRSRPVSQLGVEIKGGRAAILPQAAQVGTYCGTREKDREIGTLVGLRRVVAVEESAFRDDAGVGSPADVPGCT